MRRCHLILASVLLSMAGCQSPPPPQSGPPQVAGRVEDSDGNPLAKVAVKFHAQDEKNKGTSVTCMTQADGTFTGRCAAGRYRVTLLAVFAELPKAQEKDKGKAALPSPALPAGVPERYGSVQDTPWEVIVPSGGRSGVVLKVVGS
jgi:hypothetical protein